LKVCTLLSLLSAAIWAIELDVVMHQRYAVVMIIIKYSSHQLEPNSNGAKRLLL
jgi:hypothetical protein